LLCILLKINGEVKLGFNGDLYPTAGATSVMTTTGDLVRYDSERERYGIGSTNQILQVKSGLPSWQTSAGNIAPTLSFIVSLTSETGDLTVADNLAQIRMPFAFTLTEVRAFVNTAPVGAALTFDITEGGSTILSTLITIDVTEKTSEEAATPPVISDTTLADDAIIGFNCDVIGSSTAGAGAKIMLIGYETV
jgi:hypothetical protein